MATFGYFLSTEEYGPEMLTEQAAMAQECGFDALQISDHFHPWNSAQGQSPFVWSMIGAISQSASSRSRQQASSLVTKEMTAESVVAGPDPERHAEAFQPYLEAGFDEIYVGNMGPHYREMIRMYGEQVLPVLRAGKT